MNEKKVILTLITVGFILLLAIVIALGFSLSDYNNPNETTADKTEPDAGTIINTSAITTTGTPESSETDNTTTSSASDTSESVTTAKPVNPDPTVSDTVSTQYPNLSGKITSTNDGNLKLIIEWETIYRTDSEAQLSVKLYLSHYTIGVGARSGAELNIGEHSFLFTTQSIDYRESAKAQTLLTEQIVVLSLSSGNGIINITAKWPYKGTYSGIKIEELIIEDIIIIE